MAGRDFNVSSPRQLEVILFDELGLKPIKRTKSGRSTDADVLEQLAEHHPLPTVLLEHRQLSKLKGTYIDALPGLVNRETGRIHTEWGQAVAATGRISSNNPNLQNIPVRTDLKPNETEEFRLPAAMGFLSQPSGNFQLLINGKPGLEFNVALGSQSWRSEEGRVRMNYNVMENNDEDSCGVLQIEVAGALLEPGRPAKFEVVGSAASSQRWFGVYLLPVAE